MKTNFKLAIASLIFFITFSPISFSAMLNYSQAASENIDTDQEWTTDRTIDKDIFIGEDATLTIKKGVIITFRSRNIQVYGKMVVAGTVKNPVIFKKAEGSQNYSISIWSGGKIGAGVGQGNLDLGSSDRASARHAARKNSELLFRAGGQRERQGGSGGFLSGDAGIGQATNDPGGTRRVVFRDTFET